MNSHDITVLGYIAVVCAAAGLQLVASLTPARIPTLGQLLSKAMSHRTTRVGILVAWAWLGLHFFAR